MNKLQQIVVMGICLINVTMSICMEGDKAMPSGLFEPYSTKVPLIPTENAPTIQKDVFLSIPVSDKAQRVSETLKAEQKLETENEMNQALITCIHLMFKNDKNWHFTEFPPLLQYVNPELMAMVQLPKSYFMYSPEMKILLLRLDLGEQKDGWAFDQVIEVRHLPDLPNKGACSDILIQFHNEQKNIGGKVPLDKVREFYKQSGKTGKITPENCAKLRSSMNAEQFDALHMQDVIDMMKHYVSKPEHIKNVKIN